MSLRKIATGLVAVSMLLLVGCAEDSTGPNSEVTKLDSGKWVPVSTEDVIHEVTTSTAMGQTDETDTTYTEEETFTDTTEILLVTSDSIIYYVDDVDSTIVVHFSNDFEGELEKMAREAANAELGGMGIGADITKLQVSNYTSSVNGDTLTMKYTITVEMSFSVEMMGITVNGTTAITTNTTDKFIAYDGDVPPSTWPSKVVTGSMTDL